MFKLFCFEPKSVLKNLKTKFQPFSIHPSVLGPLVAQPVCQPTKPTARLPTNSLGLFHCAIMPTREPSPPGSTHARAPQKIQDLIEGTFIKAATALRLGPVTARLNLAPWLTWPIRLVFHLQSRLLSPPPSAGTTIALIASGHLLHMGK
jgi:hypothetical protein